MKRILIILGVFATVTTFAQSPRIKLNQITKDSLSGSVLISSPTDSGMVYSRDLYISYGVSDTVLILNGDTISAGGLSTVLSDGLTILGNGTTGNELRADTSVLATLRALSDSLALVISSVTADNVTITGDGTVGSPLKVDTTTYIATKGDLDLYYLDSNPDGYTSNTGTVTSVGGTGTVNGISLSGSVTSSGNLTLGGTLSNVNLASQVTGTLPIANGGTGSATQNFVDLSTAQTVGGAKTFTSALTQSGGDVNFDSGTFYVDESENRVGIGTSTPRSISSLNVVGNTYVETTGSVASMRLDRTDGKIMALAAGAGGTIFSVDSTASFSVGFLPRSTIEDSSAFIVNTYGMYIKSVPNVVMGVNTSSPTRTLDVNGGIRIRDMTGSGTLDVVASTTGVLATSSDERLKIYDSDIVDAISIVKGLYPKYFYWKDNAVKRDLGFYAQEVNAVLPEGATPMNNDGFYGLNSRAIIAVTVKAIQEQQEQIETLQTELDAKSLIIETQEQKITDLQTTIQALITRIENLENK